MDANLTVETQQKLLSKISELADVYDDAGQLLKLAEAYAWVMSPGQAHGGHADG